jgi:hypothetical protein
MPKPLADGLPESRYSYVEVVREIERALDDKAKGGGRGAYKAAATACKLSPQQFSQRLRGEHSKLEVEHFGAVADHLRAPKGWPFIAWEAAKDLADALRKHPRK